MTQRDDDVNWRHLTGLAHAIEDVPIRSLKISTLYRVLSFARRNKIDIVHSHGRGAGLYGRLAALILGIGTVHTYRGFHNRFRGLKKHLFLCQERVFAYFTDRAIAVSQSEKDKILASRAMPADKLEVVFNPIEVSKDGENCASELSQGRFNVVTLSRISPQKDIMTLIKVARLLGDGFAIHVYGGINSSDQGYAQAVNDEISKEPVENLVLHGDVPGAASLLGQYDAYVSTALWEGLPTAVIEAFLSGVPVVATDCTGNCDVVISESTGLLYPPGDADAIAAGIRRLSEDQELHRRLSYEALSFARKEFDVGKLVERMDDIYLDVAKR